MLEDRCDLKMQAYKYTSNLKNRICIQQNWFPIDEKRTFKRMGIWIQPVLLFVQVCSDSLFVSGVFPHVSSTRTQAQQGQTALLISELQTVRFDAYELVI